jgi:ATPase family associated with various cellular activities (AAA)
VADRQQAEALLRKPHGLSFEELRSLVEYLGRMQEGAEASMRHFRFGHEGYAHRVDPDKGAKKTSKASTATCIAYLSAVGKLEGDDWPETIRHSLRANFVNGKWRSAGLTENNPFTSAFLLEAIHDLGGRTGMSMAEEERVQEKVDSLNRRLKTKGGAERGGLRIKKYPPTSFLTHKVIRVLIQWEALEDSARRTAAQWNWKHLYQESMLIAADSPEADYFELAYSVLTASLTTELDRMTPRERRLLQHALDQFFVGQRPDGNWPRSRPLFLYPNIGYAYCYDYELLVQLLSERPLRPFITPHLDALRRAAWALDGRRVPLGTSDGFGWSSEHHGGHAEAESWPTASVFHFCFELQDLVFDAVRQDVFEYVDSTYEEPRASVSAESSPLDGLLDSCVVHNGGRDSFKELFEKRFLKPLQGERDQVSSGRKFSEINMSAILYGPPGTSKTQLAQIVADGLGWPLLALDPSHLTRRGLDNIHAEADALFGRLQFCDQVVVLMDEFDELVRERGQTGEFESRFLTTAMLPKLAALHERRRLVYIVATNHLEQFDAAISRAGRFDVIVPVMPPTTSEKIDRWPALAKARVLLLEEGANEAQLDSELEDLTYAEAAALARRCDGVGENGLLRSLVSEAVANCTLNRPLDPKKETVTWKTLLAEQQSKIRGLGV